MVDAILSRGSTSVSIKIWVKNNELCLARDIGKPNAQILPVSRGDPRTSDHLSAADQITLVGNLTGPNAYADAQTLAENLVKPHSNGTPLKLDLSAIPSWGTYEVGVPSRRVCRLNYKPGQSDWVSCQMRLPIVNTTIS